ncbi:Ig-like domain-containing domain [Treponema sp. R6D11]
MKKPFLLCLSFICFFSCDILRRSPFEVTSWSPGEGYHSNPKNVSVSLYFSLEPDRDSVERHFSLTDDNGKIKGNFYWEDEKVTFIPVTPLEANNDYNLSLSAEAHDTKGLSLDTVFEKRFTTRPGAERPFLISCSPSMYEETDDLRAEVRLVFSIPVPLSSLYDNVSFSPSMAGGWRLEEDGKSAVFTPSVPWTKNKRYEIRYSTSLADNNGMKIGNEFKSIFITGTDKEIPVLLRANRITKDGEYISLVPDTTGFTGAAEIFTENGGWEKEDRLSLVFSKPVDSVSVKNCLNVEDAPSVFLETMPGFNTEFVFRFDTAPSYESRFIFRIKTGVKDGTGNESKDEYIYRIYANGESSKPPCLIGIRMAMSPQDNTELISFDINNIFEDLPITDENYPATVGVKTWIELYFETAKGASINALSVMDLFSVNTSNNVLNFTSRQVKTDNFTIPEPQEGWEKYERVEIMGNLTNSVFFGIVNFIIGSGLKDSLGNKNDKLFRISTIK